MIELKTEEENSLSRRASRAAGKVGMGKAVLLSVEEADEVSKEPLERIKQQLDFRRELDRASVMRQVIIQVA